MSRAPSLARLYSSELLDQPEQSRLHHHGMPGRYTIDRREFAGRLVIAHLVVQFVDLLEDLCRNFLEIGTVSAIRNHSKRRAHRPVGSFVPDQRIRRSQQRTRPENHQEQ